MTGPTGATGATGATGSQGVPGGAITFIQTFAAGTTDVDPGAGNYSINNGFHTGATVIRLDDVDSAGTNWRSTIATFAGSTSTVKGHLRLVSVTTPSNFVLYTVSAVAQPTGYSNVTIAYVSGSGFAGAAYIEFSRTGDLGATGATGPTGPTGATGPIVTINPGESLGLQTDAVGAASAIALTGLEQGENLRFGTIFVDNISTGTHTAYALFVSPNNALVFQNVTNTLQGVVARANTVMWIRHTGSGSTTLENESGSAASGDRLSLGVGINSLVLTDDMQALFLHTNGNWRCYGTSPLVTTLAAGRVYGNQVDAGGPALVSLTGGEVVELLRWSTVQDAAVSTQQDNFVLNADATVLRLTVTGVVVLTGIAGGVAGRVLFIENTGAPGANLLTLANQSSSSLSAARFRMPSSLTLSPREGAVVMWDTTNSDWRVLATNSVSWAEVEETGAGPFNDYDAGAATHVHIMASNAAGVFNGVVGATIAGRMLLISHQGTGTTTLVHNSVASGNNTRFFNDAAGTSVVLEDNQTAFYISIDATSGATSSIRWFLVGLQPIGLPDDSFLANVSGVLSFGVAKTFASLAGRALTYNTSTHELDVLFSGTTTEAVGGTFAPFTLLDATDNLNITATSTIHGFTGGVEGRELTVSNGAAFGSGITVSLVQFSSSTAGGNVEKIILNTFLGTDSVAVVLSPGASIQLRYFGSRWRTLENVSLSSVVSAESFVANATPAAAAMVPKTLASLAGVGLGYNTTTKGLDVRQTHISTSSAVDLTDFNPPGGIDNCDILNIDPGAAILLNSLQAPALDGKRVRVTKSANSDSVTIVNQSGVGSAANDIICIGNTTTPNIVLRHAQSNAMLQYRAALARWLVTEWNPGIATVDNPGFMRPGTSLSMSAPDSINYTGNTADVSIASPTGNVGTVDISALTCGGTCRATTPPAAFQIEGFTAKPDGFWFYFQSDETDTVTLFDEDATATAANRIRIPGNQDYIATGSVHGIFYYKNSRWNWCSGPSPNSKDFIQSFTTVGASNDVVLNDDTTVLRVDTANSDWTISGFTGGRAGRRLIVMNASNNSSRGGLLNAGASSAGNTILTPGRIDKIGQNYSAILEYDVDDSLWRVVAESVFDYATLVERATAPALAAGQSAIWAENIAPTQPRFTNDAGTTWPLGFAASASLTSRTTITTTGANVICLLALGPNELQAGSVFEYLVHAWVTRGATPTACNCSTTIFATGTNLVSHTFAVNTINGSSGYSRAEGILNVLAAPGATAAIGSTGRFAYTASASPQDFLITSGLTENIATNSSINLGITMTLSAAVTVSLTPLVAYLRRIR